MLEKLTNPRIGGLLTLSLIILLLPLFLPNNYYYDVAIKIGINAIVVVGLNLLVGYAGQISLGHGGFFGLGTYTSAVLTMVYGWSALLALLVQAAPALGQVGRLGGVEIRLDLRWLWSGVGGDIGQCVEALAGTPELEGKVDSQIGIGRDRQFTSQPDGAIVLAAVEGEPGRLPALHGLLVAGLDGPGDRLAGVVRVLGHVGARLPACQAGFKALLEGKRQIRRFRRWRAGGRW